MIKVYRRTDTIKAEQFDNSREMAEKYNVGYDARDILHFRFETPDGWIGIKVGDFIETDVNGNHWPIEDVVFNNTYAELPVIPKAVADWIEKCKHDGVSVGYMLCYERQPEKVRDWIELTNGTYEFNQKRYTEYQDLVARAWLDGYQVEGHA